MIIKLFICITRNLVKSMENYTKVTFVILYSILYAYAISYNQLLFEILLSITNDIITEGSREETMSNNLILYIPIYFTSKIHNTIKVKNVSKEHYQISYACLFSHTHGSKALSLYLIDGYCTYYINQYELLIPLLFAVECYSEINTIICWFMLNYLDRLKVSIMNRTLAMPFKNTSIYFSVLYGSIHPYWSAHAISCKLTFMNNSFNIHNGHLPHLTSICVFYMFLANITTQLTLELYMISFSGCQKLLYTKNTHLFPYFSGFN